MFTPSQIKTTIRPDTLTVQDAGIYSNAKLNQFWNRILFSKHSDTTLQLSGKALCYSFISSNTPDYDTDSPHGNPYKTFRIGLHDRLFTIPPFLLLHGSLLPLLLYLVTRVTFDTMWNLFFHIFFYKQC